MPRRVSKGKVSPEGASFFMPITRVAAAVLLTLGALLVLAGCGGRGVGESEMQSFSRWLERSAPQQPTGPMWVMVGGTTPPRILLAPVNNGSPQEEPFPVGSITKVLTAILVLQGVEDGLLALDDVAPGVHHPGGDIITWLHLIEHRAGFVDKRMDPTRPEAAVPIVPVGALHLYSNEGYAALARALQDVHGTGFDALAQEHVFAPLELDGLSVKAPAAGEGWTPPVGASGLKGSPESLAQFAAAIASRDERLLSRKAWSQLFELEMWDRHAKRRFDDPARVSLVQDGRVTGSRSMLALFPRASASLMVLYPETDVFLDQAGEVRLLQILNEATLRWGDREGSFKLGSLNPLAWFRPPSCNACDWSDRVGTYLDHTTGAQVLIAELDGVPMFVPDVGEPLSIGPEITGARNRLHDLYRPIVTPEDALQPPWANGTDPATIEFGERDGQVIGLLWGANWYEGPLAP